VLGLVVFAPGMTHEFTNWDDWKYIVENPIVRSPSLGGVLEAFTSFHFYNYNPLHLVSYMIDAQVWGLWSGGFFLTNLLLHVGTALVFHELALRCLGSRGAAFTVAALFLVHPTRVESVAWLSERKDVLAWILRGVRAPDAVASMGGRRRWNQVGLGLFAGSPGVLWSRPPIEEPARRPAPRAPGNEPRPARPAARRGCRAPAARGAVGGVFRQSLSARTRATRAAAFSSPKASSYLWLLCPATPYCFLRLSRRARTTTCPLELHGDAVGARRRRDGLGLGFLAAASFRRRGLWLLGVVSFVAFLLPVLGFVRIQVLFAERYLYLALVGPALAAVGTFRDLAGRDSSPRWARCGAVGSAGVWVVGCAMLSAVYLPVFHDSGSLWSRVLAVYPRSSIAHSNLAHHLRAQGRLAEAASHYDADLVEKPCYEESYLGRASIYEAQGQYATAEDLYRHVLSRRPDSVAAKRDYEDFLRRQRARESATK
jgi:hypothetical protein